MSESTFKHDLIIHKLDVQVGKDNIRLLDDISLQFTSAGMHAIVGPNGSGKTSLLKTICLLHQPTAGEISMKGENIQHWTAETRAKNIAYLGQFVESHWRLNALQVVELGLIAAPHLNAAEKQDRLAELIEQFELHDIAEQTFNTLSGGERARILLARSVSAKPTVLLADEPLNGLDLKYQRKMLETLQALCKDGMMVIIVMHDLNQVLKHCKSCALIHNGKLIKQGEVSEVLNIKNIKQYFEVNLHYQVTDHGKIVLVDSEKE